MERFRVDLVDQHGQCRWSSEPKSREECEDQVDTLLWYFGDECTGWEIVSEETGMPVLARAGAGAVVHA